MFLSQDAATFCPSEAPPAASLLQTALQVEQSADLARPLSLLWAGRDIQARSKIRGTFEKLNVKGRPLQFRQTGEIGRSITAIQIAGMFDTGTNLLGATLEANLGVDRFNELCPGVDQMEYRSSADMHDGYHCHWWKHIGPPTLREQLTAFSDKGRSMLLLAMVRSPIAHILAMEDAPYDLTCVNTQKLSDDAHRSCTIPLGGGTYTGLTGVWNDYVDVYDNLSKEFPEHKVLVIEYERLVFEPEAVLLEVAHALDMTEEVETDESSLMIIDDPAKSHGSPVDRDEAKEKIIGMTYLNDLSDDTTRPKLCQHLDQALMESHTVKVEGQTRAYKKDCA